MTRALARIVGVVVLVLCLAAPAAAGDRPAVRHGDCDGASRWRLVVRTLDAGGLGVRFALGGGAAGETWNVFMDHNGRGFFAGSRISREGGIVVVRRRTGDAPGADTIRATAHDTITGETCAGRIVVS
jgi:hypothetical protein